ncbi:MAG: hypothetical protein U9R54_01060 [Bacteroidota bacterium]|nr:hypothetical protein [Bacteroidota bacterium]
MKKIFLSFICVFLFFVAFSQSDVNTKNQKFISLVSPTGGGFTFYMPDGSEFSKNRIDGSPYIFEKWQSGVVYFKKDVLSTNYKLNYNSYLDQIEFIKNGEHLMSSV